MAVESGSLNKWRGQSLKDINYESKHKGALQVNSKCGLWKGYRDLISVFNSKHSSVMHRFRFNQVLPFARNDVIVFSPLGGAVSEFSPRILRGWPWFYSHVAFTFCLYLEPFRSYSTLFLWLGFQHPRLFGFFSGGGYHPHNSSDLVPTHKRHFLAPIRTF